MADAKHTPGPWRYLEDHAGDAAGRPLTVCDAANNDLANVYSRDDATVDISREQAIANARLIAAAPDLAADGAALLKTLERLLPSEGAIEHAAREWKAAYAAAIKLRQTIARATVTP